MFLLFDIYIYILLFPVEPPLLAQGAPVITASLGQSLSIPCMLLDGIPLPERHWSQNGKAVRLIYLLLSNSVAWITSVPSYHSSLFCLSFF